MCKTVYLTSKRFSKPADRFKYLLAAELRRRGIEVVTDYAYDIFNCWRRHKTFGIAIALDFFRDEGSGSGMKINKNCNSIARDFAFNLSDSLDVLTPGIGWRRFEYVDSYDEDWYKFYNKVSATTKVVLYLCTLSNRPEYDKFVSAEDAIVASFADEILRCLRSNYNWSEYVKKRNLLKKRFK